MTDENQSRSGHGDEEEIPAPTGNRTPVSGSPNLLFQV
jgi:hypothetical protein